jgi:hypothetical protein
MTTHHKNIHEFGSTSLEAKQHNNADTLSCLQSLEVLIVEEGQQVCRGVVVEHVYQLCHALLAVLALQ